MTDGYQWLTFRLMGGWVAELRNLPKISLQNVGNRSVTDENRVAMTSAAQAREPSLANLAGGSDYFRTARPVEIVPRALRHFQTQFDVPRPSETGREKNEEATK